MAILVRLNCVVFEDEHLLVVNKPPGWNLSPRAVRHDDVVDEAAVGGDETQQLDDGWTVITRDHRRSAHFEHTFLIRNGPPEILTKRVAVVV